MNNDIIKNGNDFEVRKPLTLEQFKERYMRQPNAEEVEAFSAVHGIDLAAEIEKAHLQEYELYLGRFNLGLE